jgi:prepilin-type N-terminal cleavage/methylation domain-containing protein
MDSDDAGFSLIEVLVALAVSAMLVAMAYRGLAIGARGLRASDVEARLLTVAKTELSRAGLETPLEQGVRSGRTDIVDWTVSITPYVSSSSPAAFGKPRAYWVDVEVRARGRPAKRLTTLKLETLTDAP